VLQLVNNWLCKVPQRNRINPARSSTPQRVKTAAGARRWGAKVAPAALEVAASADGHERRHQQDSRNKPEPSRTGLTGGFAEPPLGGQRAPR
jgi:hypothetical protein